MDFSTLISASRHIQLSAEESKIPWNEPAFSQRMLANHLSQDHDWASRRQGRAKYRAETPRNVRAGILWLGRVRAHRQVTTGSRYF